MEKELHYELIESTENYFQILYKLLQDRKFSISHEDVPTFEDHKEFVKKHPYKYWYIISNGKEIIGSFYINYDNSIGLNLIHQNKKILTEIITFIKTKFKPEKPKKSLIPKNFYINVSSQNYELIKIFSDLNILKIQISYEI